MFHATDVLLYFGFEFLRVQTCSFTWPPHDAMYTAIVWPLLMTFEDLVIFIMAVFSIFWPLFTTFEDLVTVAMFSIFWPLLMVVIIMAVFSVFWPLFLTFEHLGIMAVF